jgi:hypothetical protein
MKWNNATNSIAGDILAFVDDLRASGSSKEQAWQIARPVVSRLQYLGIQGAPQKSHPPRQSATLALGPVPSSAVRQTTRLAKWWLKQN